MLAKRPDPTITFFCFIVKISFFGKSAFSNQRFYPAMVPGSHVLRCFRCPLVLAGGVDNR
ncbi:hypothetical protein DXV75_09875 [Alteromonas aestuariivivens]|uniref:Uncharacterized protein n=1 Tax=Alteromonas aestuariivivens TaxID=1938339 RepID=A0A3D8M784_9ALTE|nr:hypothetical protein DXV75_09875 [Alteromonas aestuariivivens]